MMRRWGIVVGLIAAGAVAAPVGAAEPASGPSGSTHTVEDGSFRLRCDGAAGAGGTTVSADGGVEICSADAENATGGTGGVLVWVTPEGDAGVAAAAGTTGALYEVTVEKGDLSVRELTPASGSDGIWSNELTVRRDGEAAVVDDRAETEPDPGYGETGPETCTGTVAIDPTAAAPAAASGDQTWGGDGADCGPVAFAALAAAGGECASLGAPGDLITVCRGGARTDGGGATSGAGVGFVQVYWGQSPSGGEAVDAYAGVAWVEHERDDASADTYGRAYLVGIVHRGDGSGSSTGVDYGPGTYVFDHEDGAGCRVGVVVLNQVTAVPCPGGARLPVVRIPAPPHL